MLNSETKLKEPSTRLDKEKPVGPTSLESVKDKKEDKRKKPALKSNKNRNNCVVEECRAICNPNHGAKANEL